MNLFKKIRFEIEFSHAKIQNLKLRQHKQTVSRQDKTVLSEHSATLSLLNRQTSFIYTCI